MSKNKEEMKNTISKMRNALDSIKGRLDKREMESATYETRYEKYTHEATV